MNEVAVLNDLPPQNLEHHLDARVGRILLKRPQTLNALTFDMMDALATLTLSWAQDPRVASVLVKGAGPRAFCAGGDLRAVHTAQKKQDTAFLANLFRREYTFNVHLQEFPKPYLCLMHGYTMGGGLGASAHGSHRIVCENSVLAMPETNIGYFPDVGSSAFLNRCPGSLGMYLGLTGAYMSAADALYGGIATHFVAWQDFGALEAAFLKAQPQTTSDVDALLVPFAQAPPPSPLAQHQGLIDACFSRGSVSAIFDALQERPEPFARETLLLLRTRSPLSLAVTFEHLTRARSLTFRESMRQEYRLSQHFVKGHDFHEGIRAAVVDKDRRPVWEHARLEDLDPALILASFEGCPLSGELGL